MSMNGIMGAENKLALAIAGNNPRAVTETLNRRISV